MKQSLQCKSRMPNDLTHRSDLENRASQRPNVRLGTCAPLEARLWCQVVQHCARLIVPRRRFSHGNIGLAKIANHDAFLEEEMRTQFGVFDGRTRNEIRGCMKPRGCRPEVLTSSIFVDPEIRVNKRVNFGVGPFANSFRHAEKNIGSRGV